MSDVDQKLEQANIIMNENVAGNVDPEELAMRLNISYSWFCLSLIHIWLLRNGLHGQSSPHHIGDWAIPCYPVSVASKA